VILAGGRGLRMGGGKVSLALGGRPLISYPLEAMRTVLEEVAVIAKDDTTLPEMPGVTVWIEPPEPVHPLLGIAAALALAAGRPVLVCAADLPFVSPSLLARLLATPLQRAVAVIASSDDGLQPLLGCYRPAAAEPLLEAAYAGSSARAAVAALRPRLVELDAGERRQLFNVNTPDELLQAAAMLDGGRWP
jgi:molybdenum cofactor guanylyltransferase